MVGEEDLTIRNRVSESSLISLNLEEFIEAANVMEIDLKDWLFQGMILKELDFRKNLKNLDVDPYRDKVVRIHCSADAIIPSWAYMLLVTKLSGSAKNIYVGDETTVEHALVLAALEKINPEEFKDKKVVIKGCGDLTSRDFVYAEVTKKLIPYVSSLMYGEPCSTVPVFKKPKQRSSDS